MSTHASTALAAERQQRIHACVRDVRVIRVEKLASLLDVSAATIRRDLEEMEQRGRLRRVHGGAVATESNLDEPLFDDKADLSPAEKEAIAAAALTLIHRRDTVYLDGGSTVLALAGKLQDFTQLTVVTNSLRIAHLFSGSGPRMLLVGGECRRLSQTLVGPLSRPVLDAVHVDIAFLGTIGLSVADGLTTTDPDEAMTKELAIAHARRVVLLADAAKFGKSSFVRFAAAGDLDVLITNRTAPASQLAGFRKAHVNVITV